MSRRGLVLAAALVVMVAAVVIALLIPSEICFGSVCSDISLFRDIGNPAVDHRWPIRIGIAAGGLVAGLLIAALAPREP